MVDWSGADSRTTGADSIWVAELLGDLTQIKLMNYPTRTCVRKYLKGKMAEATENKKRLLIGFDFAFGYPASAYGDFKCKNWENLSRLINKKIMDDIDGNKNKNNRFDVGDELNKYFTDSDGPFWGHRTDKNYKVKHCNLFNERPKNYGEGLPLEFRYVEDVLRETSKKNKKQRTVNPLSVWKLFNGATVGSQTLMGIPTLRKLKECTNSAIWPFESIDDTDKHVIAEIYPSIWNEDEKNTGLVKDAGQVKTVVQQIFCHDNHKNGCLKKLLKVPYDHDKKDIITEKEGWILGVNKAGEVAEIIKENRPYILYD